MVSFIETKVITPDNTTIPLMGLIGLMASSDKDARNKVIGRMSPFDISIESVRRVKDDSTINQIVMPYYLHYYAFNCSDPFYQKGEALGVSPINAVNCFLEEALLTHDFIVFTNIEPNLDAYSKYNVTYSYNQGAGSTYTSTMVVSAYSKEHAKAIMTDHVNKILRCAVVGDMEICKHRTGTRLNRYAIDYVDFDEHGRLKKKIIVESNSYDNALVEFYTLTGLPKSYINHMSLEVYNRSESGLEVPKPKALTNKYIVKYVVGCSGSVVISNVVEKSILATSQDEVLNYLANTGHPDRPITVLSIIVDSRA